MYVRHCEHPFDCRASCRRHLLVLSCVLFCAHLIAPYSHVLHFRSCASLTAERKKNYFFRCFVVYDGRGGGDTAKAVRCRSLIAEDRVRSRVSPCGICNRQIGAGAAPPPSPSPEHFNFSLVVSFCPSSIVIIHLFTTDAV